MCLTAHYICNWIMLNITIYLNHCEFGMTVAILSIQGDVSEHIYITAKTLKKLNINEHAVDVSSLTDFDKHETISAVIIPGGESTVILKLMKNENLLKRMKMLSEKGTIFFGTCAGAILLSTKIINSDIVPLSIIDIEIERNSYGRQKDSFETDIKIDGLDKPFRAIFIRAPVIRGTGKNVEILSTYNSLPVLVRSGKNMASTFHPELTDNTEIHELFLKQIIKE